MRTVGHPILMAVICVAVFIVFMAIRPARAWSDQVRWNETPDCAMTVGWVDLRFQRGPPAGGGSRVSVLHRASARRR